MAFYNSDLDNYNARRIAHDQAEAQRNADRLVQQNYRRRPPPPPPPVHPHAPSPNPVTGGNAGPVVQAGGGEVSPFWKWFGLFLVCGAWIAAFDRLVLGAGISDGTVFILAAPLSIPFMISDRLRRGLLWGSAVGVALFLVWGTAERDGAVVPVPHAVGVFLAVLCGFLAAGGRSLFRRDAAPAEKAKPSSPGGAS